MGKKLPRRALWFWIGTVLNISFIFTVLALIIFIRTSIVLPILLLIIWLIAGFTCVFYAPLYYKSFRYELKDNYLHISRGVLYVREQWIDKEKILLVSVTHNPLTPVVRLSSLFLTTPGSKCMMLTMDTSQAELLAKQLLGGKCP